MVRSPFGATRINESEYTLDLQAVLYALRGKIAAETDEPTAAIDFLFTAVVYFVARFQNADIIKSLNIHSLFSGAPSFLSFQPPVKQRSDLLNFGPSLRTVITTT